MDFNSEFNRKLLQLYILLMDEKEITYESFNEYEKLDRSMFSRLMHEYQMMIIKLKLKCTLIKEKIGNEDNETLFPKNIYYQTFITEDYSFSIDELTDDEKARYIFVIFYLMLRNDRYISPKKFQQYLNIKMSETSYKRFIDSFKELIGIDIYKNKYSSYVLERD